VCRSGLFRGRRRAITLAGDRFDDVILSGFRYSVSQSLSLGSSAWWRLHELPFAILVSFKVDLDGGPLDLMIFGLSSLARSHDDFRKMGAECARCGVVAKCCN